MALIKCPECGKEVSDKAVACPNCGYPIASLYDEKSGFMNNSNSKRMNHQIWKAMGYSESLFPLLENSISEDQMYQMFEEGTLSSSILNIFDGNINDTLFPGRIIGKRAKNAGVLMAIDITSNNPTVSSPDGSWEILLFTEGIAVVTCIKAHMGFSELNLEAIKDNFFAVPYSCFDSIEFTNTQTKEQIYFDAVTKEKNNGIRGAVIGGLVAGPAGAIVGSTIGSQEKRTKTIQKASSLNFDSKNYNIVINIKDSNLSKQVICSDVFKIYSDGSIGTLGNMSFDINVSALFKKPYLNNISINDIRDYFQTLQSVFNWCLDPSDISQDYQYYENIILKLLENRTIKSVSELLAANEELRVLGRSKVDLLLSGMSENGLIIRKAVPKRKEIYCALGGSMAYGIQNLRDQIVELERSKEDYQNIINHTQGLFGKGAKLVKEARQEIAKLDNKIDSLYELINSLT